MYEICFQNAVFFSKFVYPNEENSNANTTSLRDGKYEEFIRLDDSVIDEVKSIYEGLSNGMYPSKAPPLYILRRPWYQALVQYLCMQRMYDVCNGLYVGYVWK